MSEQERRDEATNQAPALPEGVLPLVPLRGTVLFPGMVAPITVGRPASVAAAQAAVHWERPLLLVAQRDPAVESPAADDLHPVGVQARVLRYVTTPDGNHHVIVQAEARFRIAELVPGHPFLAARGVAIAEPETADAETEALAATLRERVLEALQLLPEAPAELVATVRAIDRPGTLADLAAGYLDLPPAEKQEILELVELKPRLRRVLEHVSHRIEVLRLTRRIQEQTKEKLDERQREYFLREQLRTIRRELGEEEDEDGELESLAEAVERAGMPAEVLEQARRELRRLRRTPEASAEHAMLRTWLEWLTELPWSRQSEETIDLARARAVLDEDHHDLDKVKRRILEYLAVRKLNPEGKAPILCFVGPPGVGKTSLGRSIARALGRAFERMSLGGVHDEAEIRGHRRTYVGAMPGMVIQAIRKAGTRNPVLMLDEVDKLGIGFHGDPAAALLEVLDPEQNATFQDHYLGVPFDLSRVLFICTANVLDQIPPPLRDRMEVIELPGYTEEDKLEIARRYLIPRQLEAAGLDAGRCRIDDAALRDLIRGYTREAGCRGLERQIGALCRHAAMRIAEGDAERVEIGPADLAPILGPPRFENEAALRTSVPGVATGLAWTPTGGELLFIEATRVPGKGGLILTGQLGDVMKESAQAALSLVKSRAQALGIDPAVFDSADLHVHVPAGAIPKDGPSAGVAIFLALVSLLTGRRVRPDTAVTGEITLRGLVLPVGGIKEKVLAAHTAGIARVVLPARNRRDYEEIPEHARAGLELVWVENVDQALEAALAEETPDGPARAAAVGEN
ncbi:endopeptidase La [Inmirania thermothiophila]|uniref:Lon protease n=1 Tax=Inmirania thermothiophila TaxID=1750597 RepID=A0A3N1XZP2_9GAMM|nr:endopeptidase La [Inmirania thermothiophila]ROR32065.1 ATP-dependent Lon protease [Inmirania thermothiophila]